MDRTHADQRDSPMRWWLWRRLPRSGGARRKLLTFLVFVAFFIAFLPVLVTKTPLRKAILSAALPADDIRVTVGDASLSWFSGLSLSRVEVKNAAGDTLLTADAIRMDRPPGKLLVNPRDLGLIEIVRPTLTVKIRPDGSNVEDALAQLLAKVTASETPEPDDASASSGLIYALQLSEGTIIAEDLAMNRTWHAQNIDLEYDTRSANGRFGNGSLTAQIIDAAGAAAAPSPAGRIALSIAPMADGRRQISWQADGLALAITEPWLRRFIVAAELSGTLSSQGSATWTATATSPRSDFVTSGFLSIDRLDASAAALHDDRLRLVRVEIPWRLAARPAGIAIEDLQLRSDVARAAVRGTIDPAVMTGGASFGHALSNANLRHDVEFRGSLDMAKLAAMLPRAMRIRADTVVTSGTIDVLGKCQPASEGQVITGSIRTSQLVATSAGRPLQWKQPVVANLQLTRDKVATRLDSLACDSEFLQVAAKGTPQDFLATAKFDLNRLAEQLGQFIDLSGMELAGTGEAEASWTQTGANSFVAKAAGELSQLRVALANGATWAESKLEIEATAAGRIDPVSRRPNQVDTAELDLSADDDVLTARLTSGVILSAATPVWPASIQANGRIARWLTRARPWFAPDPWQIDGEGELTTSIRVAGQTIEAADTALSVTNLRATSPDWNIDEPRVVITGNARWKGDKGELVTSTAQFVTSTVSLAVQDLHYRSRHAAGPGDPGQLSGAVAFRADLARLDSWRGESSSEYRPQGAFTGNVRFTQRDGRAVGELTATGEGLSLSQRTPAASGAGGKAQQSSAAGYETIWQEPRLTVRGLVAYQSSIDQLEFQQLELQSNTLRASASGQVEAISTAADANVAGTLNYDLAQLSPLLRPYLGNGIALAGREQARFAVAGQIRPSSGVDVQPVAFSSQPASKNLQSEIHWSRRVRGQIELPWSGATVYGLPVGPGRVAATLGDGAIRIEPLTLAIAEGQLTAAPHVRLDPAPSELMLPAGPLITNVRISPEVSEAMLKYVAPVLAGATQSEGLFSMQLEGARVPLGEPKRADSAGKMTVHSVRVVPGPMAREWIGLAQQIESLAKRRDPAALATKPQVTLLSIRDQQVSFRVVDGRVHHQNMEFQVGDIVMRSQGSVGFDESISLVLHIPVQDAWVAKEPLLAGLKGQSLQVPISGTLTRPQMDQRAIASLSQQLLQSAAGQAIGGELNKALDKLFKSR